MKVASTDWTTREATVSELNRVNSDVSTQLVLNEGLHLARIVKAKSRTVRRDISIKISAQALFRYMAHVMPTTAATIVPRISMKVISRYRKSRCSSAAGIDTIAPIKRVTEKNWIID